MTRAAYLGPPGTFLLVTGSNMSGKSTLLRAIGLNAVLAQAGGPVCAESLSLPPLDLATSILIEDSLADGVSFFMAELWRIRLPYAVPFIFTGLKAAIALAVVGAVVAEFVNSDAGLGYLIQTSTAFFKVQLAWGALIILSLMGIVLFQIVVAVERIFFPWSPGIDKPSV